MKYNFWATIVGLLIISSVIGVAVTPRAKDYVLDMLNSKHSPTVSTPTSQVNIIQATQQSALKIPDSASTTPEFGRKEHVEQLSMSNEENCENSAATAFKKISPEPNVEREFLSHWNTHLKSCLMEVISVWTDSSDSTHVRVRMIMYDIKFNKVRTDCWQEGYTDPDRILETPGTRCSDFAFLFLTGTLMSE